MPDKILSISIPEGGSRVSHRVGMFPIGAFVGGHAGHESMGPRGLKRCARQPSEEEIFGDAASAVHMANRIFLQWSSCMHQDTLYAPVDTVFQG